MMESVRVQAARPESAEETFFVGTLAHDGHWFAAPGRSEEQARGRLANKLCRVFGEREAPSVYKANSRVLEASLPACFYVEYCYNGEELTEENLAMDEEFADDLWPEDWRSDIRGCFD